MITAKSAHGVTRTSPRRFSHPAQDGFVLGLGNNFFLFFCFFAQLPSPRSHSTLPTQASPSQTQTTWKTAAAPHPTAYPALCLHPLLSAAEQQLTGKPQRDYACVGVANGHSKKPPCLPGTPSSRCSQHARAIRSLVSAGGRETMSRGGRSEAPRRGARRQRAAAFTAETCRLSRLAQRNSPTCWRRAPWAPGQPRRRRKPSPLPCCDSSRCTKKGERKNLNRPESGL